MKITAIILLSACLTASAKGFSQQITLSRQNAPLISVFGDIERQTGYHFLFTYELVEKSGTVSIKVTNATLPQTMDKLLEGKELTYTILDKTIIIKPKSKGQTEESRQPNDQPLQIDVTGRVVDSSGNPLQGASVRVRGTKQGTTTDANGNFTLRGVSSDAILEISFSGYKIFSIKADNSAALGNIILRVDVKTTTEVVINTGYQQFRPNEVTGSVVIITKEQLDQRVATSIIEKLEGITNALVFNKNPNNRENNIRIRGESTIFANASPLVVVDNFPYDGDINDINPNDVESTTILKDAAAASIWGVQAGNGVIVITTKSGSLNSGLQIGVNANYTISNKPDLFYTPLMSSSDYIDLETLLFSRGYSTPNLNDASRKAVSPVVEILN